MNKLNYDEIKNEYAKFVTVLYGDISIGETTYNAGLISQKLEPEVFEVGCKEYCKNNFVKTDTGYYKKLEV